MANTLFILVGNIGSGKSTFAKNFIKGHQKKIVCVQRDSLRYMMGCGKYIFDPKLEPAVWDANTQVIKSFMEVGMKHQVDILIDEVNICKDYRKDYIELADKYSYQKVAIVMPWLDRKTSIDRRMQNDHGNQGRKIWCEVWSKFDGLYEEPTFEEGFNEVQHVFEIG